MIAVYLRADETPPANESWVQIRQDKAHGFDILTFVAGSEGPSYQERRLGSFDQAIQLATDEAHKRGHGVFYVSVLPTQTV